VTGDPKVGPTPEDGEAEPSLAAGDAAALDALIAEIAGGNTGAHLAPATIVELAALKRARPDVYETLRSRLKAAGARVGELDRQVALELGEGRGQPETQADILVNLSGTADLFRTADDIAYVDVEIEGHRETWPVRARGFRRWLLSSYWDAQHGAPHSEAISSALGIIEAQAVHGGQVREIFVRVGRDGDRIYLDLCDDQWRAVEIDSSGWRVVDRPPVRFRRSSDMRALPEPERDGSVDGLRRLINIRDDHDGDNDFILAIAYLLVCLRGRGPYPIMAIGGEQGSAKSTRSELLRSVIDPREPALRALPRDQRDLAIAARNHHVLAFDNVSGLRWWLSDALCRLASGAGFGTRELYADAEEVVFKGARPIIANGIEDFIERPDLAERAIFALCELILRANRLSEEEVQAAFAATHAAALGALCDAAVTGLRRFPDIRPPDLPRMADFAHWAVACEAALWKDGDFMRAYEANILGAVENVLEASPVAVAIRKLKKPTDDGPPRAPWEGTATELLKELTPLVDELVARSDKWPKSARALSGRMRRAASFLRQIGIDVVFVRGGHAWGRRIAITAHTPPSEAVGSQNFANEPSAPTPDEPAAPVPPVRKQNDPPKRPRK
jgi:hypothetical protein